MLCSLRCHARAFHSFSDLARFLARRVKIISPRQLKTLGGVILKQGIVWRDEEGGTSVSMAWHGMAWIQFGWLLFFSFSLTIVSKLLSRLLVCIYFNFNYNYNRVVVYFVLACVVCANLALAQHQASAWATTLFMYRGRWSLA